MISCKYEIYTLSTPSSSGHKPTAASPTPGSASCREGSSSVICSWRRSGAPRRAACLTPAEAGKISSAATCSAYRTSFHPVVGLLYVTYHGCCPERDLQEPEAWLAQHRAAELRETLAWAGWRRASPVRNSLQRSWRTCSGQRKPPRHLDRIGARNKRPAARAIAKTSYPSWGRNDSLAHDRPGRLRRPLAASRRPSSRIDHPT